MNNDAAVTLEAAELRIGWVLEHSGMSSWLKESLRGALQQNPIAVGNEVELLRHLLQTRADAWMQDQLRMADRFAPEPG